MLSCTTACDIGWPEVDGVISLCLFSLIQQRHHSTSSTAIYRHGNGVTTGHYTSTACHRGNCILTDDEQITAHRGFDMTAFRDVTLLIYERDDL